ncbi:hypothetical protein FG475_20495 [Vibrio navarrensis]|nr:hypothetical protein [Vibrio navarrensis]HDY8121295.1 hypothetical protein [Vibrio vulnificus]
MANDSSEDMNLNASFIFAIFILIAMIWFVYTYKYEYIAIIWKYFRVTQFVLFATLEVVCNKTIEVICILFGIDVKTVGWRFYDGLIYLLNTSPLLLTKSQVYQFDLFYGDKLKWAFGLFVIWVGYKEFKIQRQSKQTFGDKGAIDEVIKNASKVHPHLRRLIPPSMTDKILGYMFGWLIPTLKEKMKGENPLDFSHDFDMQDRSSWNNRYAMGLSATELLTACPPIGVTRQEIDRDIQMQKESGFQSNFRPICHFYYDKEGGSSSMDFCQRTATLTFSRQLQQTKFYPIDRKSHIARTFDINGNLVPLEIIDENGNKIESYKRGFKVVSGHRESALINNGIEYEGSIENVLLLFNNIEQRILIQLKGKIVKSLKDVSFEQIVYVLVKDKHAYVQTLIWELMSLVKTRGRSTGNEFTWVLREDRNLGMVMQSIGRETPFKEAAGIYSHYQCEKSIKSKISEPMIDLAVEELHKEAERILQAGARPEDILKNSNLINELFSNKKQRDIEKMEQFSRDILKKSGHDDSHEGKYFDPYSDVAELMKDYKEEK